MPVKRKKTSPKKAAPKKAKPKTKKAAPRAKAARGKKPAPKKVARVSRATVPPASHKKRGKPGEPHADKLGEWQHDHDVEAFAEDDIPPDYGGSE